VRKILALLLGILLSASPAFAPQVLGESSNIVDAYNTNIEKAPGIVRWAIGNERVDIDVRMENGQIIPIVLVTKDGKLETLDQGHLDDATLYLSMDEGTVRAMTEADDPIRYGLAAIDSGQITYRSTSILTTIKLALGRMFLNALGYFTLPAR